jgi:hypothetical protein
MSTQDLTSDVWLAIRLDAALTECGLSATVSFDHSRFSLPDQLNEWRLATHPGLTTTVSKIGDGKLLFTITMPDYQTITFSSGGVTWLTIVIDDEDISFSVTADGLSNSHMQQLLSCLDERSRQFFEYLLCEVTLPASASSQWSVRPANVSRLSRELESWFTSLMEVGTETMLFRL